MNISEAIAKARKIWIRDNADINLEQVRCLIDISEAAASIGDQVDDGDNGLPPHLQDEFNMLDDAFTAFAKAMEEQ